MSIPDDRNNKSCTLVRDQVLTIGKDTLAVHRTELTKSDFDAFTLIVEVAENFDLANNLFHDPKLIDGQQLLCCYDGTESKATLAMCTNQEFGAGGQKLVLHFACSTIEAGEAKGEVFEFLLPHVNFGQGDHFTRVDHPGGGGAQTADHIKFTINGVEWTLRTLIEIDGLYLPAPQALQRQLEAGANKVHFNPSGHCAFQVDASRLDRQSAEAAATNICWLFHLVFAQRVAWAELRLRTGSTATFVCRRSFTLPDRPSATTVLRNWRDGRIKTFVESAYPVFIAKPLWWQVTLNWFSIAVEDLIAESTSMIFCMLFDRISSHLFNELKFPKQISDQLATTLDNKKQRAEMAKRIGMLISEYTDNWPAERSCALVGKIREWNNEPSYPKKIEAAFKRAGLTPPSGELLNKRHKLMHAGGLEENPQDTLEFLFELYQHVTAVLLFMLGYQGEFFVPGRGKTEVAAMLLHEDAHQEQGGKAGHGP